MNQTKTRLLTLMTLFPTIAATPYIKDLFAQELTAPSQLVTPVASPSQAPSATANSYTIQQLVDIGLTENPRIQEAQFRVEAMRHRIPQATALPDPMLSTNTYLAPVQTAAGKQTFSLGINQKFVNRDRRETQGAIVASEVQAEEAKLLSVQTEIAQQIRSACFQLLLVRTSIEITREDIQRLAEIEEVVRSQYEVKDSVSQQDVLGIQVQQSQADNELSQLQQKEKSFQARLARLLHRSPQTQFEILDDLGSSRLQQDVDSLIAQAMEAAPQLQSQWASIQADRHRIRLAELQRVPDFTVGLNWIATSSDGISPVANGDDALLLGISLNLPVNQRRIQAGICEAHANHHANQSKYTSLQDQIAEEVFDLVAKIENLQSTIQLLQQDMIPKTQRALEISIDQYSTGSVQYSAMIDNWRTLLRYRLSLANMQSQQQQWLAALSQSVGQINQIATEPTLSEPAR